MSSWFDELAESAPRGLTFTEEDAQAAFLAARGGNVPDAELISAVTGGHAQAIPHQQADSPRSPATHRSTPPVPP